MGGSVFFASNAQNSPAISQGSFCTTNREGSHQYTDIPWRKCLLTVGGWAHRGLPAPPQTLDREESHKHRPFCNPGHLRSEFSHQVSTAKSRGGEPGAKLSRDTRLRDPLSQPLPPAGPGPPSAPHVTPSPPSSPARAPRKNQPCIPAPYAGRHRHPPGLARLTSVCPSPRAPCLPTTAPLSLAGTGQMLGRAVGAHPQACHTRAPLGARSWSPRGLCHPWPEPRSPPAVLPASSSCRGRNQRSCMDSCPREQTGTALHTVHACST